MRVEMLFWREISQVGFMRWLGGDLAGDVALLTIHPNFCNLVIPATTTDVWSPCFFHLKARQKSE